MVEKERTLQLGHKMQYCRNCINFTREDMGDLFDIDADLVADYESGNVTPNMFWTYRFARTFKIDIADLDDETFTAEDFAVKYTDSHFMNFPFSKVNYNY